MGEKPTRFEVGQRWQLYASGIHGVVTSAGDYAGEVRWDNDPSEKRYSYSHSVTAVLNFLGYAPGYGPQPPASFYVHPWPESPYDRRRFSLEQKNVNGEAMSALQVIQARKKPEPWVPSCDELHWLPDA